jgi:hypothetical protein
VQIKFPNTSGKKTELIAVLQKYSATSIVVAIDAKNRITTGKFSTWRQDANRP